MKSILIFCLIFLASCWTAPQSEKPKNIILMIGDGMGPQQVSLAINTRRFAKPNEPQLSFEVLYEQAEVSDMTTHSLNNAVTDSSASATAIACGIKTRNGMVGVGPDGKPCESVLKAAHHLGKATGLVSNVRLVDSTPGAFVVNSISRYNENQMNEQLLNESIPDVMLNGGARHLIPQNKKFSQIEGCENIDPNADGSSKRTDDKNLIDLARSKNYEFVCTKDQLEKFDLDANKKLLGVFSNGVFPRVQERKNSQTVPSLSLMTQKALGLLSKNPNGFFVMIEGGLIDYAGHENDVGTMLQETLDFDSAVGVAMDFVKKNPDTLLIVTADHESGGYGMMYRFLLPEDERDDAVMSNGEKFVSSYGPVRKSVFEKILNQKKSGSAMISPYVARMMNGETLTDQDILNLVADVKKNTDYEFDETLARHVLKKETLSNPHTLDDFICSSGAFPDEPYLMKFGEAIRKQTHSTWGTTNHTAVNVKAFAWGPGSQNFKGLIDNTDIAKNIFELLGTR